MKLKVHKATFHFLRVNISDTEKGKLVDIHTGAHLCYSQCIINVCVCRSLGPEIFSVCVCRQQKKAQFKM